MNLFICGAPNFESEEQDQEFSMSANQSPSSTPRRSRFCRSNKNSRDKNPYATRGLDKFSTLLADLEEKRQKIYAENGSDPDIAFVRFVYKNSNDLVPVVVKLRENNANAKEAKTKSDSIATIREDHHGKGINGSEDKFAIETSVAVKEVKRATMRPKSNDHAKKSVARLIRPSRYLPIVVIVILVLLAVFGRSAAILFTSILWYVVPALKESPGKKRSTSSTTKRDHAKRLNMKG